MTTLLAIAIASLGNQVAEGLQIHHCLSAAQPFELAQEYKAYTAEYLDNLEKKQFTILDDPDGQFKVVVSDRAFSIFSLETAGGFFNDAAKLGATGFDTSTELGKRASAFIRGYGPFIDENKPIKQPIINASLRTVCESKKLICASTDYTRRSTG
ncbi:MAG: hypothetical protein R2688_04010 [Fimbriimonadaceae bacterium]